MDDAVHVQVQVVVDAIAGVVSFFRGDDDVRVLPHEPLVERRHTHGSLARRPVVGDRLITRARSFSASCAASGVQENGAECLCAGLLVVLDI